jgi:hypothetical protein
MLWFNFFLFRILCNIKNSLKIQLSSLFSYDQKTNKSSELSFLIIPPL